MVAAHRDIQVVMGGQDLHNYLFRHTMIIFQRFGLNYRVADKTEEPKPSESVDSDDVSNLADGVQGLSLPEVQPLASPPPIPVSPPTQHHHKTKGPSSHDRRFHFRPFSFSREEHKHTLSTDQVHHKKAHAAEAFAKPIHKPVANSSAKRAKESALIVRALIIGPSTDPLAPQITRAAAAPRLSKVKSQLMQPSSANRLIAELRALPASNTALNGGDEGADKSAAKPSGPIHAVCLEYTEPEAHEQHFNKLTKNTTADGNQVTTETIGFPSVSSASIDTLTTVIANMHIVSLIGPPDLGLGKPGDGKGILAGALPTAETVITGIARITPQLMALGYTTGMAILPDHQGIYPPTDRISVLTYWWGLELVLPPPTLAYLTNAQSISSAIINCLTALSVINNGVREILPFVRYIGQYIDFEFNSIQKQNKGNGVVCAATWIMPAAMVPRPWDFISPSQLNELELMGLAPGGGQPLPLPEVVVTPPTATLDKQQLPVRSTVPS